MKPNEQLEREFLAFCERVEPLLAGDLTALAQALIRETLDRSQFEAWVANATRERVWLVERIGEEKAEDAIRQAWMIQEQWLDIRKHIDDLATSWFEESQ